MYILAKVHMSNPPTRMQQQYYIYIFILHEASIVIEIDHK